MTEHSAATSCRPPNGHTFLAIGQDLFSIQDYVTEMYNFSLHEYIDQKNATSKRSIIPHPPSLPTREEVLPAAYMVYTDLQKLEGLSEPTDYGSGIEFANGLTSTSGLQIGLWLGGSKGCRDIVYRKLDDRVEQLYRYLEEAPFDHIFVRLGYEFDNPQFAYSHDPAMFRQAFRMVVQGCRQRSKCDAKTSFVWHSWAAGLPRHQSLQDYYPGNDFVDWMGISLFQQFYPHGTLGNINDVRDVLEFAKPIEKPVMIAESTPFGGIPHLKDPWNEWFVPVLDLIDDYDIAMWSYINCDWESQPMWHNVGFGNTRLAHNRTVLKLWYHHVQNNPRFLKKSNGLCEATTLPAVESSHSLSSLMLDELGENAPSSNAWDGVGRYWYGFLFLLVMFWCVRFFSLSDKAVVYYGQTTSEYGQAHSRNSKRQSRLSLIEEGDEGEEEEEEEEASTSTYGAI